MTKSKLTKLQRHAGENAVLTALPGMTMGSGSSLSGAMAEISKAEPERRLAMLDKVKSVITNERNLWGEVYQCGTFFEENPDYWKAAGYDNFETFWHDIAGELFGSLRDLEYVYSYAKIACPNLFNVDYEQAKRIAIKLRTIIQIPGSHGENQYTVKKTIGNQYADVDEAMVTVVVAANMPSGGSNSHMTRIGLLARDKPEIYQKMLNGDYFVPSKTGLISLDVVAAEKEAGIGPGSKEPPTNAEKAALLSRRLRNTVTKAAKNVKHRSIILNELRQFKWIMEGLRDG